jgi:signal transduction histidine kinase
MPEHIQKASPSIWPWLAARLFPRGTKLIFWASYVILIGLLIMYVLSPPTGLDTFRFYSTIVALSVILVINIIWDDLVQFFPSENSGNWTLLVISAVLTFYSVSIGQMYIAIYAIFMIAAQANAMLPGAPAVIFSVAMTVVYMLQLWSSGIGSSDLQGTAFGLLIGMTFTITISQVLHRYTEQTDRANALLAQIQQINVELVAARHKEKELAVAEERLRMARDLHDGLGHHLTALSIQLQAAEKLVKTNPELAAEAVHNARGEVQAALKEVRQSVAVLREAPVDINHLPQAVETLVKETGRLTGLQTRFVQTGHASSLTPTVAMTLYRVAQEGLTNVQKHASTARQVEVALVYSPNEVRLSVCNDGQPVVSPDSQTSSGFGLAGLRERANVLNGKFEHGPRPEGGFQIEIILPTIDIQPGEA